MIRMLIVGALCCAHTADAQARVGLPVAAKNRAHIGGAWTPGSPHLLGGFDSRMTVNMSIDVGGFLSPFDASHSNSDERPRGEAWVLRHGLYVTPGIRIPHRNKPELKWDIIVKGGFGPVWGEAPQSGDNLQISPALVGGFDFMLRYQEWGVRFENRVWYMKPFSRLEQVEIVTVRPQIGLALQYEF